MRKRIYSFLLAVAMVCAMLPQISLEVAAADSSYVVGNGVKIPNSNVPADGTNKYCKCDIAIGSKGHWCCWNYGYYAYYYIWGSYPDRSNNSSHYLRNLSASDRTLTAEHLKKYLMEAKPGALLRIDKNSTPSAGDNDGHTLIFVKMNSSGTGAVFLEGNYDGRGRTRITEWTFSNLIVQYGPGSSSNYQYIKYIMWPKALAYESDPTITFVANGGSCDISTKTVPVGQKIGTLPSASIDELYFDGWFTQPYGGDQVTEDTYVTGNMTLYAHYSYSDVKFDFDLNGGTIPSAVLTETIDEINNGRPSGSLVIFSESGTKPGTNTYGKEIAVNNQGKITAVREYGDSTQLTVPNGGFILSGQQGWDSSAGVSTGGAMFVKQIIDMEEAYVSFDYETGLVKVFDSYAGYLYETKRGREYTTHGVLPVPTRNGYVFEGWRNDNGTLVDYYSGFSGINLTASWVREDSMKPDATLEFGGHYYELYDNNVSWTEAKRLCEAKGGYLAVITSSSEQNAIVNFLNKGTRGMYRIGATDAASEGKWKWVNGETFSYAAWDSGLPEPSNKAGENYANMIAVENPPNKQVGEWVDDLNVSYGNFYDLSNTGFICEYNQKICNHSYTVSTVSATCTTAGYRDYTCACGDTYREEIPALGHSYTAKVTAPTCAAQGYTTHTCSCGVSYTDSNVPALGHSMVQYWTVTDPATCTEQGSRRKDCTRCDYYETEVIPTTGHSYTTAVIAPTCTAQGYTTHTCSACRNTHKDSYVEALGHDWNDGVVTNAPTEQQTGLMTYTCQTCSATKTEVIPVLEHVHRYTDAVKQPTCTAPGYTTYTCSCGHSYTDNEVAALGHVYSNGTCTRCGDVLSVTGVAIKTAPAKTQYEVGQALDTTGLVLTVTYSNGSTQDVTQGFTVTGFDSATDGTKTVIVAYGEFTAVFAVTVATPTSGTCGENVTWSLKAGILTITGTGAMDNCSSEEAQPWYSYRNDITTVVVESGVTNVGRFAFRNCDNLTDVVLQEGVTNIGDFAFYSCDGLTSIEIPEGVTSIGYSAFSGCSNLADISLPSRLSRTGQYAFLNCKKLTSITLPMGVTSIDSCSFANCVGLVSVSIPVSVVSISSGAFLGCTNLKDVYYDGTAAQWKQIVINSNNTPLTTATLHTVVPILTGITVKTQPTKTEYGVGEELDTTGLTLTATYSDGSTQTVTEGFTISGFDSATVGTKTLTVAYGVFTANLTVTVKTPVVTGIAVKTQPTKKEYQVGQSLDTTGLVLTVTYSNGSTAEITEGFTVTGFQVYTAGSQTLTVTYEECKTTFNVTVKLEGFCGEDLTWVLDDTGTLTITGAGAMTNYSTITELPWYRFRDSVRSVVIGENVTSIGSFAFYECWVNSVVIPNTVSIIGNHVFFGCFRLKSIIIPDSVKYIGSSAFYNCNNLSDVYFPGTEDQWEQIVIGSHNEKLTNAAIHYLWGHQHTLVEHVAKAPNCTVPGWNAYETCETCDYTTYVVLSAIGHSLGQWETVTAATCTELGSRRRVCARCDHYETEEIPATGHSYTTAVTAPTCTEQGHTTHTCSACRNTYKDSYVEALGHDWNDGVVTNAPTEQQTGLMTYTCQTCSATKTEVIPVLEHVHRYTDAVTQPTCTAPGYTTHTCSCGHSYTDTEVSSLGHAYASGTCTSCGDVLSVTAVAVKVQPNKTQYEVGESLDTTGLVLTVTYSNGSTQDITQGFTVTGFDSATDGTQTLTVTYEGHTANFAVTVNKKAVDEHAPQIILEGKRVTKNSTFKITAKIKNNPGFSYLEVTPVFPPELTLVKVENGELISDFTKGKQYVWVADEDVAEDGLLLTLTFSVSEDVELGNYPVSFTVRTCANYEEELVQLVAISADIEVIDFVYGDATGDGVIDGLDVIRLKKYLANYDYETETSSVEALPGADANGDGVIDGLDVIRLKKYLANYDYESGESTIVLGPQ